jgi:hypothetical protein
MFQFPRCPLRGRPRSARPCAGRVAPFGDPRIAGCQRLPGAFRRVAASFLGRQRQGIHHAPFLRRPASIHSCLDRRRGKPRTEPARASRTLPPSRSSSDSGPEPAATRDLGRFRPVASRPRAAIRGPDRWSVPPRLSRGPVLPYRQRHLVVCGMCVISSCSARGRPDTSNSPASCRC